MIAGRDEPPPYCRRCEKSLHSVASRKVGYCYDCEKIIKLGWCKRCGRLLYSANAKKVGHCFDCDKEHDFYRELAKQSYGHVISQGNGVILHRLRQFDKFVDTNNGLGAVFQCRVCGEKSDKLWRLREHCEKYGHLRHRDHFASFIDKD